MDVRLVPTHGNSAMIVVMLDALIIVPIIGLLLPSLIIDPNQYFTIGTRTMTINIQPFYCARKCHSHTT